MPNHFVAGLLARAPRRDRRAVETPDGRDAAAALTGAVQAVPDGSVGKAFVDPGCTGEHSFAWATRFHRLVKDHERLPATVAGLRLVTFACLTAKNVAQLITSS